MTWCLAYTSRERETPRARSPGHLGEERVVGRLSSRARTSRARGTVDGPPRPGRGRAQLPPGPTVVATRRRPPTTARRRSPCPVTTRPVPPSTSNFGLCPRRRGNAFCGDRWAGAVRLELPAGVRRFGLGPWPRFPFLQRGELVRESSPFYGCATAKPSEPEARGRPPILRTLVPTGLPWVEPAGIC